VGCEGTCARALTLRLVDGTKITRQRTILLATTIILAVVSIVLFTTLKLNEAVDTKETTPAIRNFTIGVIPGNQQSLPNYSFQTRLAQEDINRYCEEKRLNIRFNFTLSEPVEESSQALKYTKELRAAGVEMILGYAWSSHLCSGARAYGYNNTMVLMTPSASSRVYSLAKPDTLYHLCVLDTEPIETTLMAMRDRGVKAFLLMYNAQSGNAESYASWVNGMKFLGFSHNQTLIYSEDTPMDPFMERAESTVAEMVKTYGPDQTAILWLDYAPLAGEAEPNGDDFLDKAVSYPNLSSVTWYSWEESVKQEAYASLGNSTAAKLRLISPVWDPKTNPTYERINALFLESEEAKVTDVYGNTFWRDELGQANCNIYDGLWVLSLSAIQANSTAPLAIKEVLPGVASNYVGATGRCTLDETGARKGADYVFYAYFEVEGRVLSLPCGSYDWEKNTFTWNDKLLGGS
jgi:ABC-type branched-subunit amino acid transport system substrate-binding protein